MFMDKGKTFNKTLLAEIYSNQVGLLLSRFNSEMKLRQEKQFLETTLMSIGDGIISTDRDGRISFLNPTAEELIGVTLEASDGSYCEEILKIFDERSGDRIPINLKEIMNHKGEKVTMEGVLLQTITGLIIPIECSIAPPIKDDMLGVIGVVIIFRDCTERRKKTS